MNIEKTIERAKQLKKQGVSYREAAKLLNSEGYRTAKGLPLTNASIYYYTTKNEEMLKAARSKAPHDSRNIPLLLAEFSTLMAKVSNSTLKENNKKKILEIITTDLMDK